MGLLLGISDARERNSNLVKSTALRGKLLLHPWAGIAFSRAAGTTAGLNFGLANELRCTWNNDGATYGWDSGLIVPDAS